MIKPCPYCGKSVAEFATMKEMEDCKNFESNKCPAYDIEECTGVRIICNVLKGGCGASTGYAWSKDEAVKMWNRRAQKMPMIRLDHVIKVISDDLGSEIPNEKLGQVLENFIKLANGKIEW